jgi:hypothetical protein
LHLNNWFEKICNNLLMLKTIISTLIGSVLLILYRLSLHSNYIIVHLVPHSHDDVGWLKTPEQYFFGMRQDIQRACVRDTITTTIEQLARDPSRKFIQVTISNFHSPVKRFQFNSYEFPHFSTLMNNRLKRPSSECGGKTQTTNNVTLLVI